MYRGERPASRHFHCISRRMEPESGFFFLEGEKQIANHICIKIFIIIFLAIVFKRKNSNFKLRTKLAKSVKKIYFFIFLFRWLNILRMAFTICSFLMNFKLIFYSTNEKKIIASMIEAMAI